MKKNIILVGSIPPPHHGSSIYFLNLLNSDIKKEYKLFHLDTSDHRDLSNISKLDIINVYLALKNIMQLIIAIWKYKPDMIYIPNSATLLPYIRDGLFILVSYYFSSAKIVIHLHGGEYFRREFYNNANIVVKYFIKYTLSKVNTAIVLGENLRSIFDGLVENIYVLYNGSELEFKYLNDTRNTNENIQINYLGNLFKSKGIIDLLVAAKIVLQIRDDVEFNFAGLWWEQEPNTKAEALKIIEGIKRKDQIKFVGKLLGEEKIKYLLRTDIFVFPTWYPFEGLPLVILEAMAAGCPVISTKGIGAIPEIVVNGHTGILIDAKSPNRIADAILQLIENPELRKRMGEAGKLRFDNEFTLKKNIKSIIEIFNKVLYN